MKEYDFKIKRDGVWYDIDLQEKPAMSYQINNLGELNNRHVNYSQALTAPITPKNSNALGYPELNDVATVVPYSKYECRLFVEDCELAGVGSYCILYNIDKDYRLQVLGNAEFFSLISEFQTSSITNIVAKLRLDGMNPANFTDYYKYAFMSSVLDRFTGFDVANISYYEFLPLMNLYKAVVEIITELGYSLNFLDTPANYNNLFLSIKSLDAASGYMQPFTSAVRCNGQYLQNNVPGFTIQQYGDLLNPLTTPQYIKMKAYPLQSYKVAIKDLYILTTDTYVRIMAWLNSGFPTGTNIYNQTFQYGELMPLGDEFTVTYNQAADEDDNYIVIKVELVNLADPQDTSIKAYTVDIEITPIENINLIPTVPLNGTIDLLKNTGFQTGLDVFKAYVNLLGLMVQVNEVTKTVNLCTLNYIISQKDSALDWTNKIEYAEVFDKSFDLGFAQRNILTLQRNEIDAITNEGIINCNNQTLPAQVTIIDLPLESGRDVKIPNYDPFAKVNQFETDPDTGDVQFVGCVPHILVVTEEALSVNIKDGTTTLGTYTYNIAQHYNMTAAASGAYAGLGQMLTNPLKIKCRMLLTPQDIAALNQVVPVYIHQFGKYFYINKISNYQFGEKTEVELIKIIG